MSGRVRDGIVDDLKARPGDGWVPKHLIVRRCRGTAASIRNALRELVERGDLEKKPDPRDRRRRVYRLGRS